MKHTKKVLLVLALTQFNLQATPEIEQLIQKREITSQKAEEALNLLKNLHTSLTELESIHQANQNQRKIQNQMPKSPISPKALCFPLRPKNVKPTCTSHLNTETIERNDILNNSEDSFINLMSAQLSYCKRIYQAEQTKAYEINEEIEKLNFAMTKQLNILQTRNAADRQ